MSFFTGVDITVFGGFLLLSLLVGVYHSLTARFHHADHTRTSEYLVGGNKLPILPVVLSLLTTFISGIALLSVPSEIYLRGFAMGLSYISGPLSFILIGITIIPIFFKLQFINAYEYFEMRFNSVALRNIASLIFIFNTLIYLAVVVYAPAIALAGVTDVPLWPFVLSVGVVATLYTTLGGIKAVIWTDSLQAIFLYVGLGILLVKGTIEAGGFFNVFDVSEATGRLTKAMNKFHPSPFQYHNFYIAQICGFVHYSCIFGLNQMALQRYCAMPSLKDARTVMCMTVPAQLIMGFMTSYIGLMLVAYFDKCDPVALGEVDTPDQLTILMAVKVLGSVPGMPGVFLATLFSATLSTVSSGLNSMVAVVYEDLLKPHYPNMADRRATLVMKGLTIVFGIVSTAMAFGCQQVGGIFHILVTVLGATSGPLVGLFFLGIFVPSANKNGAFVGLIGTPLVQAPLEDLHFNMYFLGLLKSATPQCAGYRAVKVNTPIENRGESARENKLNGPELKEYRLIVASVIMIGVSIMNNIETPYADYVLTMGTVTNDSNASGGGCNVYSPREWKEVYSPRLNSYFDGKSDELHFGSEGASYLARLSPYSYSTVGLAIVLIVAIPVSWIWHQPMTDDQQRFAFACTYRGLDVKLDGKSLRKHTLTLPIEPTEAKELMELMHEHENG